MPVYVDNGQASDGFDVTPNNSTDLAAVAYGFFCTTAGTVKVTMANGTALTFTSVACQYHPLIVKRIWATGTTATGIIGLKQ